MQKSSSILSKLTRATAFTFFVENVPPEHFQGIHISSLEQGEAVLSASPRKSCRFFSPHSPCARRMAQEISPSADGDQGRCPWTLPAFFCKKLLDRKKFLPIFPSGTQHFRIFHVHFPREKDFCGKNFHFHSKKGICVSKKSDFWKNQKTS